MKKAIALCMAAIICFLLVACGIQNNNSLSISGNTKIKKIGLSMPTNEQPIWEMQATQIEKALESTGYDVIVNFADDDSEKQIQQIEDMISAGADTLVIVAVDRASLSDVCRKAKDEGCLVIAEDRLIEGTDAVDLYITFNIDKMGEMQGRYIADALDLDKNDGPFNLEIFSGPQDDANADHFYDGAMNILKPYLENGKLTVRSGEIDYSTTTVENWESTLAEDRCHRILSDYYTNDKIDACLVAADCLAEGVIQELDEQGYGTSEKPYPIITGQDAELQALKNILAGKQSMTAFLDAGALAELMVGIVVFINAGREITPDKEYNNGKINVPTLYYDPYLIDAKNVNHLIDVGFYTKAELIQ